jgi:hypothetical protein
VYPNENWITAARAAYLRQPQMYVQSARSLPDCQTARLGSRQFSESRRQFPQCRLARWYPRVIAHSGTILRL